MEPLKPTYERDGIRLYHASFEDVLHLIGPFDAVVTDLPYGIGESCGKNKSRTNLAVAKDYGDLPWDSKTIDQDLVDLLLRKSKYQILFGGQHYKMPPTTCQLTWNKLTGRNDFADFETAWTNLKRANRMLDFLWAGMLRDSDEERVHPTQKPIDVMRWCLSLLPKDAKVILDPCCGSATTALACMRQGLEFIGIEQHEEYVTASIQRIEEEFARTPLLEGIPIQQTCLFEESA